MQGSTTGKQTLLCTVKLGTPQCSSNRILLTLHCSSPRRVCVCVCVLVGAVVAEMPPAQHSLAVCSSPCSLQHNVIKEEGATALAEALLTNRRLITLQ